MAHETDSCDEKARALNSTRQPPQPHETRGPYVTRRQILGAVALVALIGSGWLRAADAERVTVKLDADQIDFTYDRKFVSLSGNAQVHSRLVADADRSVRLRADTIEGDLSRGRFELIGDVRIVTPKGTMEGASAVYNTRTTEYSIRKAALMAPLTELTDQRLCGYAYAREIAGAGDVVYLVDGRFTTCNRADPHYYLDVDRLTWDPETQQVTAEGGALWLYGLRIPLLPSVKHSFKSGDDEGPDLLPFPGYSSRGGLQLGWEFLLGEPTDSSSGYAGLRLRQRKGWQTWAWGSGKSGPFATRFGASLRENVDGDIDRVLSVDRLPEAGVTGTWALGDDRHLEADLLLGHYHQHEEGAVPSVTEQRAKLAATLRGGDGSADRPGTSWWWLRGSHAAYGDGGHYSTVGAGVGGAAGLTDWLSGSAELSHHEIDGASPFVWDDIDIASELNAGTDFRVGRWWRVGLGGRYDLDRNELRSWNVELRRWEHCLTWKLGYHDASDFVSVGVEINGLFGDSEPPPESCSEEGPPDCWGLQTDVAPARSDTDGAGGRDSNDAASEAIEPQ